MVLIQDFKSTIMVRAKKDKNFAKHCYQKRLRSY